MRKRLPFATAYALPMCRTRVCVPRTMVTVWVLAFHVIVPPKASMMGAMGANVRPHLIWGPASFLPSTPLILMVFKPMIMMMTIVLEPGTPYTSPGTPYTSPGTVYTSPGTVCTSCGAPFALTTAGAMTTVSASINIASTVATILLNFLIIPPLGSPLCTHVVQDNQSSNSQ